MLDLESLTSEEVFSHQDDDNLITQFDLPLSGQEVWATDKNGGLSHFDLRENDKGNRRRWDVGNRKKLGGVSINRSFRS